VESGKLSNRVGADRNLALLVHDYREFRRALAADIAHQHGGAPVHEALSQSFVQRVGELLLDRAGALRHLVRADQPVDAMGDIGPGAHAGDPVGKRVDVALTLSSRATSAAYQACGMRPLPSVRMRVDAGNEAGMVIGAGFAEVGKTACRPEPADRLRADSPGAHFRILGEALEHREVDGFGSGAKAGSVRTQFERADERVEAAKLGIAFAPVEVIERGEAVLLDRLDLLGAELAVGSPSLVSVPNVPSRW
jgi:hypothetical protein